MTYFLYANIKMKERRIIGRVPISEWPGLSRGPIGVLRIRPISRQEF